MNYFRKTKFREYSLIIVALFIAIVYFTTNIISLEQGKAVQEIMDARVEEAVEEALNSTTTSTTTTITKQIPTGLVQGPITNVSITKSEEYGEIYQMLVGGVSVSFDSSALYLNGINIFSVSDSTNYSANYPVVGGWYDTDYLMKGFISNFRVIKGTALYTQNFIPPTRKLTKPFKKLYKGKEMLYSFFS